MEDRKREWIHKPVFDGGPLSRLRDYFRNRLKTFREEHEEFDLFLKELHSLLSKETNPDYQNLRLFLEGEAEVNWITPRKGCMFNVLIKLFNLCLSPSQAYDYIKKCHYWYVYMIDAEYELCSQPEYYTKEQAKSHEKVQLVEYRVEPKKQPNCWEYHYIFHVKTLLKESKTSSTEIELICDKEEMKDALMLFSNYQNDILMQRVAVIYR